MFLFRFVKQFCTSDTCLKKNTKGRLLESLGLGSLPESFGSLPEDRADVRQAAGDSRQAAEDSQQAA